VTGDPVVVQPPGDGVVLRTLAVNGLPLIVVVVGDGSAARQLHTVLVDAGLEPLDGLSGRELPKGARVGFVLDGAELRLVDEGDNALFRAPRAGVESDWVDAATRLRGTMTVVVDGDAPDPHLTPSGLVAAVDDAAAQGRVVGAIVGVHLEATRLPLIF
jgi:hypothetical protein